MQNSVELLKVGESGLSHPDDQIFIDETVVGGIPVELVDGPLPVQRLDRP